MGSYKHNIHVRLGMVGAFLGSGMSLADRFQQILYNGSLGRDVHGRMSLGGCSPGTFLGLGLVFSFAWLVVLHVVSPRCLVVGWSEVLLLRRGIIGVWCQIDDPIANESALRNRQAL